MYWLRWHYHVKDIAGAPYKIKKERKKEKKNKTTESPTVSSRGQCIYIAFILVVVHERRSGMDHTVLPAITPTPAFTS